MPLPRAGAFRTALRQQLARGPRSTTRVQVWRSIGRRGYASGGGHEPTKAASDWPWAIGAFVVTAPTCTYILSSGGSHEEHGEGHDGEHGDEGHDEQAEGDESQTEEASSEGAQESDGGDSGKDDKVGDGSGDTAEGDQGKGDVKESKDVEGASEGSDSEGGDGQDTPATSDGESSDDDKGDNGSDKNKGGAAKFKGPTKGSGKDDERMHIPDAKGAAKKRINSGSAIRLGSLDEADRENSDTPEDAPASAKSIGAQDDHAAKQEGISNTDTKHSVDVANDPNWSKKGEGGPETAKIKGTVNPSRPQV